MGGLLDFDNSLQTQSGLRPMARGMSGAVADSMRNANDDDGGVVFPPHKTLWGARERAIADYLKSGGEVLQAAGMGGGLLASKGVINAADALFN